MSSFRLCCFSMTASTNMCVGSSAPRKPVGPSSTIAAALAHSSIDKARDRHRQLRLHCARVELRRGSHVSGRFQPGLAKKSRAMTLKLRMAKLASGLCAPRRNAWCCRAIGRSTPSLKSASVAWSPTPMTMTRRRLAIFAVAMAVTLAGLRPAGAQAYPARPRTNGKPSVPRNLL